MIAIYPSHQQEIVSSIRILMVDNENINYFFGYNWFVLIIRVTGWYQFRNLIR